MFENIWRHIAVFLISALPLLELRVGIITALAWGIPLAEAFPIAVLGSMFPVPFILLLFKFFVRLLKNVRFIGPFLTKVQEKAIVKSKSLGKLEYIGLCLFVAIPLPGTGAWTAAVISSVLGLRIKYSLIAIAVGLIICAVIMSLVSYGLIDSIIKLFT